MAPNIYRSSVWTLLRVKFLKPRVLKWLIYRWKICSVLLKSNTTTIIKGGIHNLTLNDALFIGFLLLIVKIIKSFSL